jgi:anhydro-N-acetylmuramic acid kinase
MAHPTYFIGLISGTSLDAIDCALVSFNDDKPVLQSSLARQYPPELRQQLLELCQQPLASLESLGEIHIAVGEQFAKSVRTLLEQEKLSNEQIVAIGSHGQTVFHKPAKPLAFSLQIGDPNTIALQTGIATVADFRGMDLAAGGQGAPLAPLFHRAVFGSADQARVIVNLGGIANISILAPGQDYLGYDTGPANVLLDYWADKHLGQPVDLQGAWAASGQVEEELLGRLLDDPYFASSEPKSTGREYFNGTWLEQHLAQSRENPAAVDVQATLLELTAATVAMEIENQLSPDQVFLCGGGAHNTALLNRIQELLPDSEVASTAKLGISPDWVEAMTFAWLARQRLEAIPQDTRSITGAERPVILGSVYRPD